MLRVLLCFCLTVFFVPIVTGQVNLSQGLVAYYPFNGNANDVSGNGNHGTVNGATLTEDRFGTARSAYYFDGVDDFIQVANSATLNQSQAMTIVVYFNPQQHGVQTIIGKINYNLPQATQFQLAMDYAPYPGILYGVNPDNNGCIGAGNNGAYVNTGNPVLLNQWYCAVATFDNSLMRFYVNGTLISTTNSSFNTMNACTQATMQIGSWWNGDPQRFKGKIDDVRVYNRALNQQEVDALCPAQPCSDWLSVNNSLSGVKIGDLDIAGNQLTIEATFNRRSPYSGGRLYAGDLVSKHADPNICNYSLRPSSAEITTSAGYFVTPVICDIELNKTYHAAMVYDGIALKFYRNGYLMSQVPANGNLALNDLITTIGDKAGSLGGNGPEFLDGFINEVRIWNVARSQADIRNFMASSLSNPSTQPGLQAYYVFDNLTNKQGNAAWNGALLNGASIRQTNMDCAPVIDSCSRIVAPVNVLAAFTTPDTVCINNPVTITNQSVGASNYFWNFCVADLDKTPDAVNIGNPGAQLNAPVFMDYVQHNGNYYGFVVNYNPSRLTRLDFGNSLLNTPTAVNLGDFGGALPNIGGEGIQVVFNEGAYYAIIVGGTTIISGNPPRILTIKLGATPANPTPVAINWGDLGNMDQPIDLHLFQEGNTWYGFTVNAENNTITRFNFTNSFENTPTAVNLGNIGNLAYPTGIHVINDNGTYRVFITNGGNRDRVSFGQCSLTRLDFGNSLLNTPAGVNLGNPGNLLQHPRDLTIMRSCDQIIGFAVNGALGAPSLVKFNFNNDLLAAPTAVSLGNAGGLDFPHSISKLFRVNEDIFGFITNVANQTITRLRFAGCTNASIPNSSARDPQPIRYNIPGTYNINLTVDVGLPTQSAYCRQVVVVPAPVAAPTQELVKCETAIMRIGTGTRHVKYRWNTGATTDSITVTAYGTYWVEKDAFGCKATDTFKVSPGMFSDFGFKQDVCDPFSMQFFNVSTSTNNPWWDLGDGTIRTGVVDVSHRFAGPGDYTVRFSVSDGVCTDTVDKVIAVRLLKDDVIQTADTVICDGTAATLRGRQALSYCWSPATYLDNPSIQSPTARPLQDMTYYLTTESTGANLVVNGDFSAGNTGFTSQYRYTTANVVEGEYSVGSNVQAWHPNMSDCKDHTTGNGNMIMFNGSPVADVEVWRQTITVTPNTNFAFSTWIQSIYNANAATLQFSINGKMVGNLITASLPTCVWRQFYTTWNSGSSTTATISIVNKNTNPVGNDFALDDISFSQVLVKYDSVVVKVEKPVVRASNDTIVCVTKAVSLLATGAEQYTWLPATGLSNPGIANPLATPTVSTQYIVTGVTVNGCTAKDTVEVQLFPKPVIAKTADTLVCRNTSFPLHISGADSYLWSTDPTLLNPTSDRPVVTVGHMPVTYHVGIKDVNGCESKDSVKVSVRPYPTFLASKDQAICAGSSQMLMATGGDRYEWHPATLVDAPYTANTLAKPDTTTLFSVYVQESTCGFDTTMSVQITVNPVPVLTVEKENDVNCNTPTAQLRVSGALNYSWSPVQGLDRTHVSNPIASIDTTTTYVVAGRNRFGCTTIDSIQVLATKDGIPRFVTPNAFTPNGDGNNDCFGIKRWGNAIVEEFAVYNRWGQRVFQANSTSQCWDGRFNGKDQEAGGYVYIIRAKTLCGAVAQKGMVMLIR